VWCFPSVTVVSSRNSSYSCPQGSNGEVILTCSTFRLLFPTSIFKNLTHHFKVHFLLFCNKFVLSRTRERREMDDIKSLDDHLLRVLMITSTSSSFVLMTVSRSPTSSSFGDYSLKCASFSSSSRLVLKKRVMSSLGDRVLCNFLCVACHPNYKNRL